MAVQFWDTVMKMELLILIFVRALKKKIELSVEILEELAGLFFALDHYNYARWIPIHIHNMKSLPITFEQNLRNTGYSIKKIFIYTIRSGT